MADSTARKVIHLLIEEKLLPVERVQIRYSLRNSGLHVAALRCPVCQNPMHVIVAIGDWRVVEKSEAPLQPDMHAV